MRLRRVRIENFRSIQTVDFEPSDLCALIGGNNTGKSNILRAIDLVLGRSWPGVRSVDDRDFFGYDETRDIIITLWFDELRSVRGDVGDPVEFSGIQFRVTRYKRASGIHSRGDLRSEFVCVDNFGEPVEVLRVWRAGRKPSPVPASVTSEVRDALPTVFVDVDRNASYHLSGSQWSILGRLLNDISRKLKADKARFGEFLQRFEEARLILHTEEFKKLQRKIVENIQAQTGLSGVDVDLDAIDPINLYKSFSVMFKDPETPQPVDAERMGSGIQSAVVISLLQAYRELHKENAVLLFEEPELFLHPHGRRHLFYLLCALADRGTQVLYSTHSQDFVALERMDGVRVVTKTADGGTKVWRPSSLVPHEDWPSQLKMVRYMSGPRNEVFFADSVVIVEGPSDEAAIKWLADMMPNPLDLDRLNCSVIHAGSKDCLPILARLVVALGKRVMVIADTDADTSAPELNEARRRRILNDRARTRAIVTH